jgi:hypothetical protein
MSQKDVEARVDELFRRRRIERAAELAAAKKEAGEIGKEPFDLDKFDQYPHPDEHGDRQELIAHYEDDYYLSPVVQWRGVRTMEDYAKLLMELDVFKDTT